MPEPHEAVYKRQEARTIYGWKFPLGRGLDE
jgi:hypothetical protein